MRKGSSMNMSRKDSYGLVKKTQINVNGYTDVILPAKTRDISP
jgi:hypothetical protein